MTYLEPCRYRVVFRLQVPAARGMIRSQQNVWRLIVRLGEVDVLHAKTRSTGLVSGSEKGGNGKARKGFQYERSDL